MDEKFLLRSSIAIICGILGATKAAGYARHKGITLQGVFNVAVGGMIGWAVADIFVNNDTSIGQLILYSLVSGVIGGYVLDTAAALTPRLTSAFLAGWGQKLLNGIGLNVNMKDILYHKAYDPWSDKSDAPPYSNNPIPPTPCGPGCALHDNGECNAQCIPPQQWQQHPHAYPQPQDPYGYQPGGHPPSPYGGGTYYGGPPSGENPYGTNPYGGAEYYPPNAEFLPQPNRYHPSSHMPFRRPKQGQSYQGVTNEVPKPEVKKPPIPIYQERVVSSAQSNEEGGGALSHYRAGLHGSMNSKDDEDQNLKFPSIYTPSQLAAMPTGTGEEDVIPWNHPNHEHVDIFGGNDEGAKQ